MLTSEQIFDIIKTVKRTDVQGGRVMVLQQTVSFIHRHFRLIIGAAIIMMILGVFFLSAGDKAGHVDASTVNQKYFKVIEVECDDTLWSIAEEYISEEYHSIEEYIKEVKSINNLTSDKIYSGGSLVVPYYAAPQ